MTTIKADPAELRHLAHDLRQSAAHLRQLGDQAIGAAASAQSPAAAGTMAEAASFASGAHMAEIHTGVLASGTERVADLFEAADRGGGWFSIPMLLLAGRGVKLGRRLYGTGRGLQKLWKNVPHDLRRSSWRDWQRKLGDARYNVARYWGQRGALNTLRAWKNTQLRILRDPRKTVVRFVNQGARAFKGLSKNTSLLRKVAPLTKFGGKFAGKVLAPLNVVQSYKNSKASSPAGKITSVFFSTVLTKNPVVGLADIATGNQLSKGVDGVVNTLFSAGDSDRMSKLSEANAKGENGWAMQGIQAAGDGLAEGIYNGWSWLSNGH